MTAGSCPPFIVRNCGLATQASLEEAHTSQHCSNAGSEDLLGSCLHTSNYSKFYSPAVFIANGSEIRQ